MIRVLCLSLVVTAALASCTGEPAPVAEVLPVGSGMPLSVQIEPIRVARGQTMTQTTSSSSALVQGARVPATFHPMLREGKFVGGADFGLLVDERGQPLPEPLCGGADFGALIEAHGRLFHLGHMECRPGALWLTELEQQASGALQTVRSAPVDLSSVGGGHNLCAGDVTPWNTLLSAEEFEADASRVASSGLVKAGVEYPEYQPEGQASYYVPPHLPYVYDHGWILETAIMSPGGDTDVSKHYSMGRFSHEIAVVMPDQRTVYMTDDGVNGGFFMYLADAAGDLSAGTLYAAKWNQTSAESGGQANLDWISLGHATDDAIRRTATSHGTVHFDDLMQTDEPVSTEETGCAGGFLPINEAWGSQCVAVRPGVDESVLSRFETRRYAALKGATTEFRKMEGLTWDPDHEVLYAGLAEIGKGMTRSNAQWDTNGPDHIGVMENRCGGVYALPVSGGRSDADGQPIDSPFVATSMRGFLLGRPEGFGCDIGLPANPDNVAYLPGSGLLMVAEDSPHHPNNLLWSVDVGALHSGQLASVQPVLAAPPGGEVTGLAWFPDVRGHGYLTTSIQHPWANVKGGDTRKDEERRSVFGYFGPFPALVPPPPAPDGVDAPTDSQ
ncbi:MAG: alkaline phosphatase PhoX [Myxococcota bacterium]